MSDVAMCLNCGAAHPHHAEQCPDYTRIPTRDAYYSAHSDPQVRVLNRMYGGERAARQRVEAERDEARVERDAARSGMKTYRIEANAEAERRITAEAKAEREREAARIAEANARVEYARVHDAEERARRAERRTANTLDMFLGAPITDANYAAALDAAEKRAEEAMADAAALRAALEFYAAPETYFAIGFFPDPMCGAFMGDFSGTKIGSRPGKRAREALASLGPGAVLLGVCRAPGHV